MKKDDNRSILEDIFEGLHIYEHLKEEKDQRLEELIKHFNQSLSETEFLLIDEMLSRQAAQVADRYPQCFALGVQMGYRLAGELELEKDKFDLYEKI